jgi:UDP-N-acetyl-D-galactosamine dehydrogenase
MSFSLNTTRIAILGQGYVGLPLAVAFAQHFPTLGYDTQARRIQELQQGLDRTQELDAQALQTAPHLQFSATESDLAQANVYIITVPTPIDANKNPDLSPLKAATQTVAKYLKPHDVVIYESTVYPGCTEEDCVPLLERGSGLKYNQTFFCGYSPERVVPGDKQRTLTHIVKITSGSTPEAADFVNALYATIIEAGTYRAPSIKVAEAAKVIENCQRDLNISFVNELALIFDRLNLDTAEVLQAAGTKFNFLPFKPGLVGGHCISVDPYYLTAKAESVGYVPQVIHSGRRINDNMGQFIASKVVKLMVAQGLALQGARVLVLGITFKENCPDLRNSKVVDVIQELQAYGLTVDVMDPQASPQGVSAEYQLSLKPFGMTPQKYDGVVLAVAHKEFLALDPRDYLKPQGVLYDVKSVLPKDWVHGRL